MADPVNATALYEALTDCYGLGATAEDRIRIVTELAQRETPGGYPMELVGDAETALRFAFRYTKWDTARTDSWQVLASYPHKYGWKIDAAYLGELCEALHTAAEHDYADWDHAREEDPATGLRSGIIYTLCYHED